MHINEMNINTLALIPNWGVMILAIIALLYCIYIWRMTQNLIFLVMSGPLLVSFMSYLVLYAHGGFGFDDDIIRWIGRFNDLALLAVISAFLKGYAPEAKRQKYLLETLKKSHVTKPDFSPNGNSVGTVCAAADLGSSTGQHGSGEHQGAD